MILLKREEDIPKEKCPGKKIDPKYFKELNRIN
jgi:hypothetical protein